MPDLLGHARRVVLEKNQEGRKLIQQFTQVQWRLTVITTTNKYKVSDNEGQAKLRQPLIKQRERMKKEIDAWIEAHPRLHEKIVPKILRKPKMLAICDQGESSRQEEAGTKVRCSTKPLMLQDAPDAIVHSKPKRSCLRKPGESSRSTRRKIIWCPSGDVTDEKEITPYKKDASALWYVNGCAMECNICEQHMSVVGVTQSTMTTTTMRGAPGRSCFAQWQTVCRDCISKERLAEVGGLFVLSMATADDSSEDDRSLRKYIRMMLQEVQKSPPSPFGQDTLLLLVRALQHKGLKVAGCPEDTDALDMREKAMELAISALSEEEKNKK